MKRQFGRVLAIALVCVLLVNMTFALNIEHVFAENSVDVGDNAENDNSIDIEDGIDYTEDDADTEDSIEIDDNTDSKDGESNNTEDNIDPIENVNPEKDTDTDDNIDTEDNDDTQDYIEDEENLDKLEKFTFIIKNKDDKPIDGAYVSYSTANGNSAVAYSNSSGEADFDISSLSEDTIIEGINSYTVKKFKYEDVSVATGAAISFYEKSHSVIMYELPLITLTGVVTSNNQAVAGAEITLEGYDNYSAVTKEDGSYEIRGIYGTGNGLGKEYQLSVAHTEYQPFSTKITIYDSDDILDVSLTEKLQQENFRFQNPNPGSIDILSNQGVTYQNQAEGGSGEGAISYHILSQSDVDVTSDSDIASIDPDSGVVTFKRTGTITVEAVKEADSVYKSAKATYQITFTKADIIDLVFDNPNPAPINTLCKYINQATSITYHGEEPVVYSVISGSEAADVDSETGELYIKTAGQVVVQAKIAESTFFHEASTTYTITIEKTKPGKLRFENPSPSPQPFNIPFTNKVTNVKGSGTLTYTSSDLSIAQVNKNGVVTAKKPGTVKIMAKVEGDSIYEGSFGFYMITFTKAPQDEFAFDFHNTELTYGDEFYATVTGAKGTGAIYFDTDNKDIACFEDPYQNKLTIRKAGTVTIYATIAEDDYYESLKISKQITIHKASQTLKFEKDGSEFQIHYGEGFTNTATGEGKGAITYTIVSGNDIASINRNTGELNFKSKKVGTIRVKAYIAEDNCYKSAEAEYTLKVSYMDIPDSPYTLTGMKHNDKGWYYGNVRIVAREGYHISYSNDLGPDNVWSSYVEFSKEGINTATVYFRNMTTGGISDAFTTEQIQYDSIKPTDLNIRYSSPLCDFLAMIRYLFFNEVTVTLEAKDTTSGIEAISYFYIYENGTFKEFEIPKSQLITKDNYKTVQTTFTIKTTFRGRVTFNVEDTAGNLSYYGMAEDNRVLVVDTTSPVVSIDYNRPKTMVDRNEETVTEVNPDTVLLYDNVISAQIKIQEENFFEGTPIQDNSKINNVHIKVEKTNLDGSTTETLYVPYKVSRSGYKEITWTQDGDYYIGYITLSDDGDYVITVDYEDHAGMPMEYTSDLEGKTGSAYYSSNTLRIDKTKPEMWTESSTHITNQDLPVTFKVKEHNFCVDDLSVVITAKDIEGNILDSVDTDSLTDYLKQKSSWTKGQQDCWMAEVTLTESANYFIDISYTDKAGNKGEEYHRQVTVDKQTPGLDTFSITYSEPVFEAIINTVTFGYFKSKVTVTLQAQDNISKINSFEYIYTVQPGASGINTGLDKSIIISESNITYKDNGKTAYANFEIDPQFRGNVAFCVTDSAGNKSAFYNDEKVLVIDSITPERRVIMNPVHIVDATSLKTKDSHEEGENLKLFFREEAVIYLEIEEANFYPEDVVIQVVKDGEEVVEVLPDTWVQTGDIHRSFITLTGEGEYIFTMEYADRSSNQMKTYQSATIIIDNTPPEISADPIGTPVQTLDDLDYYDSFPSVQISVKEKNFRAEDITAVVKAETVDGQEIEFEDYNNYLRDALNWEVDGEIHTITIPVKVDARYKFEITFVDLAKNEVIEPEIRQFVVDTTIPENTAVSYSTSVIDTVIESITFGFYHAPVVVTIQADDTVAGIYSFDYKAEIAEGTDKSNTLNEDQLTGTINLKDLEFTNNKKTAIGRFEIPAQFRGYITFVAKDASGNFVKHVEDKIIVTDDIAPNATISFNKPKAYVDANNDLMTKITDSTIFLYAGAINVDIAIKEANFFEGMKGADGKFIQDVKVVVKKVGVNGGTGEIEYVPYETTQPGKGILNWIHDGDMHRASFQLKEDGDYVVSVTYKDKSGNEMVYSTEAGNQGTYSYTSNTLRIDTIAPVVRIDVPKEMTNENMTIGFTVVERNFNPDDISVSISAVDCEGNTLSVNSSDYISSIKSKSGWKQSGDTWTKTVEFNQSGNYTITMSCTDKAGNASKAVEVKFTIDKDGPALEDLRLIYSAPVLSKVIEGITFGYYQKPVLVTMEASDKISGISAFEYKYTLAKDVSDVNKGLDAPVMITDINKVSKKTALANFEIPPEFVGSVQFRAIDLAGNTSPTLYDDDVLVVDSITPERAITMTPVHIVDAVNLETRDQYMENAGTKLLFAGDAVLTLKINEANFYKEDVVIKVSKNKGEFTKVQPDEWVKNKDEWTTTLRLSGDGDYVVTIEYNDRSGNIMKAFTSDTIVIDTIKPVIHTEINDTPVNKLGGVNYYDSVQTMTINITEHNFRPKDVTVDVVAENVEGNKVKIQDYNQYLRNSKNWVKNGDTYTAVLTFKEDANYSFDISYKDLAFNEAKDYKPIKFTVDTHAPLSLDVGYSAPVLDMVMNALTFGFYNAKAEVKITALDGTGGIDYFTYSYTNEHGNSITDQKIDRDKITYTENGKVAMATFTLPSSVADNNGQFRGTISFTAYDSSGNKTKYEDGKVSVVDSIAPNMEVQYNQPVQIKGDTYYYAGDVQVSFHMSENNFYPEDFKVSVTRNGSLLSDLQPSWNMTSNNTWIGSFTISGRDSAMDGEYVITAEYMDKSNNSMESYKSQNIIIDTIKPEMYITGVEDHSAYKKDTIGFSIKVNDTNLEQFEPEVYGSFIDENYGISEEKLDTGEYITIKEGEELVFNIENLERDGVYKITCKANDLAGNSSNIMFLTKDTIGQKLEEKSEIIFSVNRNGSTFMLSTYTANMINNYYINEVKDNIQISEINVDPLEKIDILLNEKQLTEGQEFAIAEDSYAGKWYRYNYSIDRSLFLKEGSYSLVVKTMDKAGSISYSDIKRAEISFVVDKTKPEITISGIRNDGRYRDNTRTATLIPKDPGGKLDHLKITMNGNQKVIDLSSDKLDDSLMETGGIVKFDIPSGMGHFVEILCVDKAGNNNLVLFNNITVSTDWYVLFYANKRLFWGTVSAASFTFVGSLSLAFFNRKRRLKRKKA